MRLYFYILERHYNKKPFVRFDECEVVEKPKTYYPVDKFPNGIYFSFINKSDIGRVLGLGDNIVVLTKPNTKLAKEIFVKLYECKIRQKEDFIEKEKAVLNEILKMEESK